MDRFEIERSITAVEEKVYKTFLENVPEGTEQQFRYFAFRAAKRLMEGVELSLMTDYMAGQLARELEAEHSTQNT